MTQNRPIEQLFGELIELPTSTERQRYLERICADNQPLRAQLEKLVAAHVQAGSFFRDDDDVAETIKQRMNIQVDSMIGPYKLRERLGAGGMGVVWAAEQKQPLRRKVAVKLIKPGMDTSQVIARFEAEREALALMDHPNIARVLDAGATDEGHPYFVMELIHGVPITEYCDAHKLTIRERLELFLSVCKAVQHAHQKGIIHRDIKPSNVLITEQDGVPTPKVIDFGVAKALHQPLIDRSIYTGVFQAIGTLAYMSPEQAALSSKDVDTRADVYGLGVLLYELLTGALPFDRELLEQKALDEALRIIREQDAPKPSTKLSQLGDKLTVVSVGRRTDASGLCRSFRGELDWIVMRALEKDRNRRYESASAFGEDVSRFLNNDTVAARPASAIYRLRKFVAKNRAAVVTVGTIGLALILGCGAASWGLMRERATARQLRAVLTNYHRELEMNIFEAALGGKPDRAKLLLAEARIAGVPEESLTWLAALVSLADGDAKRSISMLEQLRTSDRPFSVAAHATLAMAYLENGRLSKYYTTINELRDSQPADDAEYILLGETRWLADDAEQGIRLLREGLQRRDTPVVRAMCARAMMTIAAATPNSALAKRLSDEAVQNITVAELMARDLPLVRDCSVLVHHGAMRLCAGTEREAHQARARLAASSAAGSALGELYRAQFYQDAGDFPEAKKSFVRANEMGDLNAYYLAPFLFGHSPNTALVEFSKVKQPYPTGPGAMGARAFLLALTPGKQKEAIALAGRVVEKYRDFDTRVDSLCVSLLAGDRDVAEKARQLRSTSFANVHEFDRMLDHLADDCNREELESIAETSIGRHAHYYVIGVKLLASGEREQAKAYFRRSVALHHVVSSYPLYSSALLKQLEQDPTWPSWLPTDHVNKQKSDFQKLERTTPHAAAVDSPCPM